LWGSLVRLGVEAAIGGGAPPLLPCPRTSSIKLAVARLLEFFRLVKRRSVR